MGQTISKNTTNEEALKAVAPLYAGKNGKLTHVLQYVYQAIYLDGHGEGELATALFSIASDEIHHFELLGKAVCALGAPPAFCENPSYPVRFYSAENVNYCKNPRQMICNDVCMEENAIARCERTLCFLKGGQTHAVIAKILDGEREHLNLLKDLLERF